jgi:hypothetical protein
MLKIKKLKFKKVAINKNTFICVVCSNGNRYHLTSLFRTSPDYYKDDDNRKEYEVRYLRKRVGYYDTFIAAEEALNMYHNEYISKFIDL